MQNKISLIVHVILFALAISSCVTKVPDVPICFEIEPTRGYCIHTISSKEREINDKELLDNKTWWEARPYMLYLPVSSWVEIKKFIITTCKKTNNCDAQISNWERTVQVIDSKVNLP